MDLDGFRCSVGDGRVQVVMMSHSRKKVKRHKRRMKKPAYQLEKSLLKLQHMFEEEDPFSAFMVLEYLRRRAHTPDVDTYRGMLDGFDEIGTIGDVEMVLEEMTNRRIPVDEETLFIVLRAYARRGDVQQMLRVYEAILQHGSRVDSKVFSEMIRAYCRLGDHDGAEWTWKEAIARKKLLDGPFLETKMELLRLRGDPDAMDLCFFDMVETYGFAPSADAIRTRTAAFADAGWLFPMEDAFADAEKFFIPYTESLFFPVVRAYVAAGDLLKAEHRYKDMTSKGIKPSGDMLTVLFDGFLHAKDRDGMERIMREMAVYRVGPVEGMIDRLACFYSEEKNADAVLATLKKKMTTDLLFNAENHRCLREVVGTGGHGGDVETAPGVVSAMEATFPDETENFHHAVAFDFFVANGRLREAGRVLTLMDDGGLKPSLSLFNRVIALLCGEDQPEEALDLLERLEEGDYERTRRTFDPLVRAFTRQRNLEGVVSMYGRMYDLDFLPRYRTRQWLYRQDWREPAIMAAIVTDSPHRIPFYDRSAIDEFSRPLYKTPSFQRVRWPRRGRANYFQEVSFDLEDEMDNLLPEQKVFFGNPSSIYELLRRKLVRSHRYYAEDSAELSVETQST